MRATVTALLGAMLGLAFVAQASAALTTPATLSTTNLMATSFTLKWSAATGATGGIAGYDVFLGGAPLGTTTTRTFAVTGLAPTTTYSLTVVARDGAGHVSPSSAALAVTTPADTTAPGKPTALVATALTTTSFTLGWTAPADNVGVTGYNFYRAGVLVGSSVATTVSLTGLAPDTMNKMTVKAFDAAGNLSAASAVLSVRTLADPPSVPTGLNLANLKAASYTLKWAASTGGTGGIANYDVYRDGALVGTTTRLSYAFTAQTPLTTYSLTVAARDHEGRVTGQSAALIISTPADTTKPTIPKDLNATSVTHQSFTLMWTPSTDNVGVTAYDVYRNGALLGATPAPTFNATGLTPLTVYQMKLKARDAAGNITGFSATLAVTTAQTPNVVPAVTLTAPANNSFFTLPFTLTLSAVAADSDGSITSVEFFDGMVSLGVVTAPSTPPATYTLAIPFASPGSHLLFARATDNRNATTDSAPVSIHLLPGLPYAADFEVGEGYVPGSLHDQLGWTVATGTAQVTANDSASGDQSVQLAPGATVSIVDQEIGAGATNPTPVYAEVFAKPVAGAIPAAGSLFDLDNARLGFVLRAGDTVGRFAALDGDGSGAGTWQEQTVDVPLDGNNAASAWPRLTVRLDYAAKTWDFYLDGRLLASDLKFRYNAATRFSGFSFRGHPAVATGLDDLFAATDNPLFTDADRDGLDDAWETAHGLNPAINDRNGDLDADGLTNIREYVLGTKPNAADSDADGLSDALELTLGTNPLVADTDSDGLPDGWERQYGLNPLSDADAAGDPDGDGFINLEEFQNGTDPNVNDSAPTSAAVVQYAYDASGRLVQVKYLGVNTQNYMHSPASNLTQVSTTQP